MIDAWTAAIEATALAGFLRSSVWAYPLVSSGHVLGVALLVGSIVPLDLRLLGLWEKVPVGPLWRVLTRSAAAGLALAIFCGALLFMTRATLYAESALFAGKMAVVAAATANALLLHARMPAALLHPDPDAAVRSARVRFSAGVSLSGWLSALILGRLIGYF